MRHIYRAFLFAAVLPLFPSQAAAQAGPAGHWEGRIQMGERDLGITVDLATGMSGVWTGSMTVAGSTAVDVPLSSMRIAGQEVHFTASLPRATSFQGRLSADAAAMTGTVSSPEGVAPFDLARRGDAAVKLPPPSSALPEGFAGHWEGTLQSSAKTRRVGLRLTADPTGTASGVIAAIDDGLEIPATTVTAIDGTLFLEARSVSGTFRGSLGAGEIAGEWSQGSVRLPLTFKRVVK